MVAQHFILVLCVVCQLISVMWICVARHHVSAVESVWLVKRMGCASELTHSHGAEGQSRGRNLSIRHDSSMLYVSSFPQQTLSLQAFSIDLSRSIDYGIFQLSSWGFVHAFRPLVNLLLTGFIVIICLISYFSRFAPCCQQLLTFSDNSSFSSHNDTIVHGRGSMTFESTSSHHD